MQLGRAPLAATENEVRCARCGTSLAPALAGAEVVATYHWPRLVSVVITDHDGAEAHNCHE